MTIKEFFKKYSFFIGLFIFVIILTRIDFRELVKNIGSVKINYFICSLLLLFPTIFIRAWRWNRLKRRQGIVYRLKDSFLIYSCGIYIGLITPGKIGEIIRALYLKKDGHSLGRSLVSIIIDRLSDIAVLFVLLMVGILFFTKTLYKNYVFIILICLIFLAVLIIILRNPSFGSKFANLLQKLIPQKYKKSWNINSQDFLNDIKKYHLKDFIFTFLITAVYWFLYFFQIYVLAKGLNIDMPFLFFSFIIVITGIITLLPISVSGIGTRDAAMILLMSPLLISPEKIITLSFLIFLVSVFAALIGFVCWILKPLKN